MQPIFRSRSTVPIRFITSIYIYVYSSTNHRRISFRAPPVDLSTRTGECMLSINRRFEIYTESYRRSQGHRSTDHPALYNASNLSFQDETNFLFDISILRTETRFFFSCFSLKGWPTFAFSTFPSKDTTFGRFGGIMEVHFRS